jgi:hypothetical protein
MDLEVPSEEEIRSLSMGDLIILRNQLLSATGTRSMAPMTRYETILDSTLGLAVLYAGRAAQPPAPSWVREIDQATGAVELPEPEPEPVPVDWEALALKEIEIANASAVEEARQAKELARAKAKQATMEEAAKAKAEIAAAEYDDLDSPEVTARIKELIDLDYENAEIWQILSKEFKFSDKVYQG